MNVRRWSLHRFSAEGVELLPRLAIGHDAAGEFLAAMTWVKWAWWRWSYQFTWHHALTQRCGSAYGYAAYGYACPVCGKQIFDHQNVVDTADGMAHADCGE